VTARARLVLAMLLGLACCTGDRGPQYRAAGNASPRNGGVLRYATPYNVSTLDPAIAYDEVSWPVLHALFDTLVDYTSSVDGNGLGLAPRLAERWTVSPNGLVYTFTLRRSLTFSDGSPVTASDFVYSLQRVRDMADSPFAAMLGEVERISAQGDRELVIELQRPNAAFIYLMAMPFSTPLSRAHVQRTGDALRSQPLGTGPFVLG
jgi:peptide/nickel transport system substrate-binding protein